MDRTKYIGSSDARDILSGDWDRLYRLKTGLLEPDDLSDNFKVQLGILTEDFHLDWSLRRLMEQRGEGWKATKQTKDGDQHFVEFVPDETAHQPLLGSHPDQLLCGPTQEVYPMEVKHTGRWRNAEEAADFYMPQLQHHMLCWGTSMLLFSVIVGTEEPQRLWIGASKQWQDHYIDRCDEFWGHLSRKEPPAPVFYDSTVPTPIVPTKVKDSVPINGMKKRSLEGSNSAMAMIDEFITTKEAVATHEKVKKDLKALMQDDEKELYSDRLTLKRDARGAIRFKIHDDAA